MTLCPQKINHGRVPTLRKRLQRSGGVPVDACACCACYEPANQVSPCPPQPGREMCAAGYCLYGSSCCLVLSVGDGVSCFTLDPSMVRGGCI